MGTALYIVAKEEISDFDMLVDGKALAAAEEELSAVCARAGVRRLIDFFSQNPDELADLLGEDVPNAPQEQWFEASDGLATVRVLLSHLESRPERIKRGPAVIEDLKRCEQVLAHLHERKIPWHFAIDI
jgi:hypothetical protein